jgi:chromatin segregation and condensation protein Rec8/ScpA/Scc1 (kleisin family)
VLFLSNAGKITLQQEVMYGPLYIARPDGVGGNGQMPPVTGVA